MTFARRALLLSCCVVLLAAVAPRLAPAPHAALQSLSAQPAAAHSSAQAYSLPPEKLARAIAIGRIRQIMQIFGGLWGLAVLWLLLATRTAASLAAWAERRAKQRRMQGLLFFASLLILLALANLPLDLFAHHISFRYGISVQGWGGWFADQLKALGLSVVLGAPVMLLFHWIVRRWPHRYWLGIWVATLPLMLLSVFAEPLLEPIFNHYEPLSKNHPALVKQLQRIVSRTGTEIPPQRMFLMKASEKTNGLNAYVSGIGSTKRIVVWDTTAGRIPDDEILFIFGHESGHYVLNHIPKGLACAAVFLFFLYWACAGVAARLARRFGAGWGLEDGGFALSQRVGFVVLLLTVSAAGFLLEPMSNALSRYFEHQADVYGQEAIHGIVPDAQKSAVAAFNHLGEAWLEDPNPSPFVEFWEYNHPSAQRRANFAAHYDPWANGGHGRFFEK